MDKLPILDDVVALTVRVIDNIAGERGEHARVVVCAGRGTAALARAAGLSLPVRQAAHVRLTFEVRDEPPERVACLLDASGDFGEAGAYAAPQPGNRRYPATWRAAGELESGRRMWARRSRSGCPRRG